MLEMSKAVFKLKQFKTPNLGRFILEVRNINYQNPAHDTGSMHARPSARSPIDMRKINPAQVSAKSPSNISPNPT